MIERKSTEKPTTSDLITQLIQLSEENRDVFLNGQGAKLVVENIRFSFSGMLGELIGKLSEDIWEKFIDQLGMEYVRGVIRNDFDLQWVIEKFPETRKISFIAKLGIDHVKKLISNAYSTTYVGNIIGLLPETGWEKFIDQLGIEFVCARLGRHHHDFIRAIQGIPEIRRLSFVTKLGIDNVKKIIGGDANHFVELIKCLHEKHREDFLKQWGIEQIIEKIVSSNFLSYSHLGKLIGLLPDTCWERVTNQLGIDLVRGIITGGVYNYLVEVIKELPDTRREPFIAWLGIDFVRDVLREESQKRSFGRIIRQLPDADWEKFINQLGMNYVHSIIEDEYILKCTLERIQKTRREAFLITIGVGFVKSIAASNIFDVLKLLPETDRDLFLVKLEMQRTQSVEAVYASPSLFSSDESKNSSSKDISPLMEAAQNAQKFISGQFATRPSGIKFNDPAPLGLTKSVNTKNTKAIRGLLKNLRASQDVDSVTLGEAFDFVLQEPFENMQSLSVLMEIYNRQKNSNKPVNEYVPSRILGALLDEFLRKYGEHRSFYVSTAQEYLRKADLPLEERFQKACDVILNAKVYTPEFIGRDSATYDLLKIQNCVHMHFPEAVARAGYVPLAFKQK